MSLTDASARAAAVDPTRSFIVQAPAGSGKTGLLIQRYLRLLAEVERPESVLAITFTNKAAAEMRHRVLKALAESSSPRPESEHAARTWDLAQTARKRDDRLGWRLEQNPHRLEIRTIDSLCASLVRRMPWLSKLGSPLDVEQSAEPLYRDAARRTLAHLETEPYGKAVARLLLHFDNNAPALEEHLVRMLGRRDQWLRHILHQDGEQLRQDLEAALVRAVGGFLAKLHDAVPPGLLDELTPLARFAAENLVDDKPDNPIVACRDLRQDPGVNVEDVPLWQGLAELLLTKDDKKAIPRKPGGINKNLGFPPTRKEEKRHLGKILERFEDESYDRFRMLLHQTRRQPPARFEDPQWEVVEALLVVLKIASAELRLIFGERKKTDFSEIASSALTALGHDGVPTGLAYILDSRIEHLLVDEFQDTSFTQQRLFELLTAEWTPGDGRTLFLVGDPMQSIYRFREAEVGVFLDAIRNGLGPVPLEFLELTTNFRSAPAVVDWVNKAFPAVFPPFEDRETGAVKFTASDCANPDGQGKVDVHPLPSSADEPAKILEIIENVRVDRPDAKIAVLARKRNDLPAILKRFRDSGLRYRQVEIDSLAKSPVVQDLLALTRAVLHADDRIAWLAVLRAPWCGLTLADLHHVANHGDSLSAVEQIFDPTVTDSLEPDGALRLRRVQAVLEASLKDRNKSLRRRIEGAWLALGGPATLASESHLEDASTFFDLLDDLDQAGDIDLTLLNQRLDRLYAAPDALADDTLQVMTIHKAKGLEFDVVILPGLGKSGRGAGQQLLLWLEKASLSGEPDLFLAPIKQSGAQADPLYNYLKDIEKEKEKNEVARLLYVAATRAKSELHLLAEVPSNNNQEPTKSSFLDRLWAQVGVQFAAGPQAPETPAPAAPAARTPILQRLAADWTLPDPPRLKNIPEPQQPPSRPAEEDISYRWVGDTMRHVGTVVHGVLQHLSPNDAPPTRNRIETALNSLGVDPERLAEAVDRVEQALQATLADQRGRWILDPSHREAQSEVPIAGLIGGRVTEARVDRTFVDRDGVRWIIDFKTSSHEGGDLESFLDNELVRYRGQIETYRKLYSALDNRPIRAGLYFPLYGEWREYE